MKRCCKCTGVDEGWKGDCRSTVGATLAITLILLSRSSSVKHYTLSNVVLNISHYMEINNCPTRKKLIKIKTLEMLSL